jgi:hypothetical protein
VGEGRVSVEVLAGRVEWWMDVWMDGKMDGRWKRGGSKVTGVGSGRCTEAVEKRYYPATRGVAR